MAETTAIGWCDATINFWHGCQKVSEGCKYCYMFRDKEKFGQDGSNVLKTSSRTISTILQKLNVQRIIREQSGNKEPLKIFTCSWSDFFVKTADVWRQEAWDIIRKNPEFVWIILTKRIERVKECLPPDWGNGWKNVWLCVSAENQERWDERVPQLLATPAQVRGVSAEPLLSAIVPKNISKLNWVIVGGESGNDTGKWLYRPCELIWIKEIVHWCNQFGVAVFVKQLGTHLAKKYHLKNRTGDNIHELPDVFYEIKKQQFP